MQQSPLNVTQANNYRQYLYWSLGVFLLYVLIRAVAWNNTVLLEDTDSLGNIRWIKVFLTFDLKQIFDIDPDFTPFYLFFSALFSLLTGSVETGARLASFVFSILLFVSVAAIGRYIARPGEAVVGLLLLSFSPALVSLSYAVLTEPSYIATIYLGLWLFWLQYKQPTFWYAVLLGVVFALSFLNRLEGIIFLAVIPFLQGVHYFFVKDRNYNLKHLVVWAGLFMLTFAAVIAPQVWRVSNIVGDFALNGRQVWSIVMNNPDGRSYDEKIHGLDYSPSEYNIIYLKRHPESWKEMTSTFDPNDYIQTVISNLRDLKRHRWSMLIGFFGTVFFLLGLIALYRRGRVFEPFMTLTFISACMVPPLLHNVVIRHIAVIAPIIFLVAGIGIVYAATYLQRFVGKGRFALPVLSAVFLLLTTGAFAQQLREVVIDPPTANKEYSPAELLKPISIIREIVNNDLHREPVIVADRGYLAHYADAKQVYLPYADYDPLIRYCELNHADFLYLQDRRIQNQPFYEKYRAQGLPDNYVLIYNDVDARGGKVELYRVLKQPSSNAVTKPNL
jgi:hypothetical protein